MILKLLSKDEIIRKYLELEKENAVLKREKEALEKELRKYKNPNTPPSAHPHLKPMTARRVDVKSHKRGAPNGHNGTTKPRKIIGAFRSVEGTIVYETLASLIATWQLQKLDIKKEMHRMLTTNLC